MTGLLEIRKKLPVSCRILAVSKLQSIEKIRALHDQGQIDFGENYVQEAKQKQGSLADLRNIKWHFIGHLQKNKVKEVVGFFDCIHSVDSLELAQVISRKAVEKNIRQKIFLEVNLALEETKGGFPEEVLRNHWESLKVLPGLEIRGFMTMPPLFEDPEKARPYFRRLRELRDEFAKTDAKVQELSMGTSSDYLVAAAEGATWVRLGTLLFGERPAR